MTALSGLLLLSTMLVRLALVRQWRWGLYLDLASVPAWLAFYWLTGAYFLLLVPLYFAALDVKALTRWWA